MINLSPNEWGSLLAAGSLLGLEGFRFYIPFGLLQILLVPIPRIEQGGGEGGERGGRGGGFESDEGPFRIMIIMRKCIHVLRHRLPRGWGLGGLHEAVPPHVSLPGSQGHAKMRLETSNPSIEDAPRIPRPR